jgi:ectoine hydroxylase-related dioxygenase (phytanoyl-CoA dioxygenase family)
MFLISVDMVTFYKICDSLSMNNTLNPHRLSPDELVTTLGAFGSWPKDRSLPHGYFTDTKDVNLAPFYKENGFVVVHNALSTAEVEELKNETTRMARNENGLIADIPTSPASMPDQEVIKQYHCIFNAAQGSEVMYRTMFHPKVLQVLTQVIGPNVKCMQSMLFIKASGKPGQAWHQDEDYIPTRDRSLAGAWIALDDATMENGCLWVLPKSQQRGMLWPQKFHFDERFDCANESYRFPWANEDSLPVEMKAGSIVFFNGYLLHRSLPNRTTSGFRRSLVNHFMSAESFLPWGAGDGETPIATHDDRGVVLVAGEDPYAYKGYTFQTRSMFIRGKDHQSSCAGWTDEKQIALAKKAKEEAEKPELADTVG